MHTLCRIVALGVIGLLVSTGEAQACSCVRESSDRVSFEKARARAHALFRGRVETLEPVPDAARPSHYRVTFVVTETFKGPASPRRVVTTEAFSSACGYSFQQGGDYLVYAGGGEARGWRTDSCSRTRPTARAAAELTFLRGGASPFSPPTKGGCTRCFLEATARVLVCPGNEPCAPLAPNEVERAVAEGRPFWTRIETTSASQPSWVLGRGADGKAFRLERRPAGMDTFSCMNRASHRGCERLMSSGSGQTHDWTCDRWSAEETLCDEADTRPMSH